MAHRVGRSRLTPIVLGLVAAMAAGCSAESPPVEPVAPALPPPVLGDAPAEPTPANPPEAEADAPPTALPDEPEEAAAPEEPPAAVDDAACPTPPRMRRLNQREYLATVADLFAGMPLPRIDIPADPQVGVFDNDADALSPSTVLVDQYAQAALDIAATVEQHVDLLVPCDHADPWCPREFIDDFGHRAFRRPLTDAEHEFLLGLYFRWSEGDFVLGIQAVVQAMLQSPGFLYRIEDAAPCRPLTPFETATRLSYALWGTMPDDALLDAAEFGRLSTDRDVRWEVGSMIEDPRFEAVYTEFFRQWMDLDRLDRTTKPPEAGFDDATRASYRAEIDDFVAQLFRSDGTLSDLLLGRRARVDARMAALYEVPPPPRGQTAIVQLPDFRAGFLNRGAFLASHAHPFETSPVLRGVFVLERLLCVELGEQPADTLGEEAPRERDGRPLTTRERTELITGRPPCSGCHDLINPIGFSFEYFDTLGRARTTEREQHIDGSGHLPDGRAFDYAGEMVRLLAEDDLVRACFARQWIQYLIGDADAASDPALIADVTDRFHASGYEIRALVRAIVTHPRFARNVRQEASR